MRQPTTTTAPCRCSCCPIASGRRAATSAPASREPGPSPGQSCSPPSRPRSTPASRAAAPPPSKNPTAAAGRKPAASVATTNPETSPSGCFTRDLLSYFSFPSQLREKCSAKANLPLWLATVRAQAEARRSSGLAASECSRSFCASPQNAVGVRLPLPKAFIPRSVSLRRSSAFSSPFSPPRTIACGSRATAAGSPAPTPSPAHSPLPAQLAGGKERGGGGSPAP